MNPDYLLSKDLNRLIGRLVRVHGFFCMGNNEHYAMLIAFKFIKGVPCGVLNMYPENHSCVILNDVPIFRTRQEALQCKADITAYRLPTKVGRPKQS